MKDAPNLVGGRGPAEIYLAPNRASAETAIAVFVEKYDAKYAKAVDCRTKDQNVLLAFYDFPAEADGLQAGLGRGKDVATIERTK